MVFPRIHVISMLAVLAVPGFGQPPRDMERQLARVEQFKKVRLIEILQLSEDQSVRFFGRLQEHDQEKRRLMEQKEAILNRIERLVRNNGDEKEFEQLFAGANEVDHQLFEHEKRFIGSLGDILSIQQRGKLMLFEKQFQRELRDAMREMRRRERTMSPE